MRVYLYIIVLLYAQTAFAMIRPCGLYQVEGLLRLKNHELQLVLHESSRSEQVLILQVAPDYRLELYGLMNQVLRLQVELKTEAQHWITIPAYFIKIEDILARTSDEPVKKLKDLRCD